MRLVIQRVSSARVTVDTEIESGAEVVGSIGLGLLVLVGMQKGDGPAQVEAAAAKLAGLRLFEDEAGRMNLDSRAAGGAFLVVSQFTLAGSLARGRRPSFDGAMVPDEARGHIGRLVELLRGEGFEVASGRFGASMDVELVNRGPVTFVLDVPSGVLDSPSGK